MRCDEDKRFYVYLYTDPRNGNPIYVGKGSLNRYKDHLTYCRNNLLKTKIKAIRNVGLEPKVDIILETDNEVIAYDTEEFLIGSYGLFIEGGLLCNISKGGRGNRSKDYPEEFYQMLGNYTDQYISENFDVTRSMVSYIRRSKGIPVSTNRTKPIPPVMGGHNKIELPEDILQQLGKVTDSSLARQANVSSSKIKRERVKRGIPMYGKVETTKPRNNTVYSFQNIKTSEIFEGNIYEFSSHLKMISSDLHNLIKGKSNTCKGWRLL